MSKQKWIILIAALALMGGAAVLLTRLQATQKLGEPGVKTSPIPGSVRLQVDLPEHVLDYTSEAVPVDKLVLDWLPQDTSFGQRHYRAPDGFQASLSVVLMGRDRTSLHKTEFCMEGQGWVIDREASSQTTVHMDRPCSDHLPVMKYIATKQFTINGQSVTGRGVYVFWFVADDDEYTAQHWRRMWWMARDLFLTGVLQRWAMVSCFSVCSPGQENATFERLKKFMVASVPEFQRVPRLAQTARAAGP